MYIYNLCYNKLGIMMQHLKKKKSIKMLKK